MTDTQPTEEVVKTDEQLKTEEETRIGKAIDDPIFGDNDIRSIGRSLGLEKEGDIHKYQHQLERLIEWAHIKGAKDSADAIWQIQQLANRIGGPRFGESNLRNLSNYAYLEMERSKLDQQLKKMGGS